eukprot:symbB.v1.2.012399.t1/scaffold857.1/size218589/14
MPGVGRMHRFSWNFYAKSAKTRWASSVVVSKSCVPWNERPQGVFNEAGVDGGRKKSSRRNLYTSRMLKMATSLNLNPEFRF